MKRRGAGGIDICQSHASQGRQSDDGDGRKTHSKRVVWAHELLRACLASLVRLDLIRGIIPNDVRSHPSPTPTAHVSLCSERLLPLT